VNKPRTFRARPLAELVGACVNEAFKRQGFASMELVTHWDDIVGPEIAAHCEPIKLQWTRAKEPEDAEPATLVLRVEGPAALEVQHLSGVLIERVNRFFGWQAVGRLAMRQAPLQRRAKPKPRPVIDAEAARRIADGLVDIDDADLRAALGRLGAAIKRT
jgi:hypothetical protein